MVWLDFFWATVHNSTLDPGCGSFPSCSDCISHLQMFGLGVTPIGSLNLQSSKRHHFDDIVSCKHGLPPLEIAFFS
jgi:hypothetical protein